MSDVSFVEKVVKQVKRLLARDGMHPGMIIDFAGENPPEGWLWCDGAEVSRAEYPALFKAIGTKYGAGNGSTTFNLPDSRRRVREGANNISEVGQKVEAGLPDINGGFGYVVWTKEVRGAHKVGVTIPQTVNRNVVNQGAESVGWVDFQASLDSPVHGKSNTVQTNALRLLAIVKY